MRNKKENKMRGSGKSLYYIFVPKSSLAGTSNPLLIPQIKKKKKQNPSPCAETSSLYRCQKRKSYNKIQHLGYHLGKKTQ